MVKNSFLLLLIVIAASSCSSFKPAATQQTNTTRNSNPRFIENISTSAGTATGNESKRTYKVNSPSTTIPVYNVPVNADIESFRTLQFKYAMLMDVPVEAITNVGLMQTIDDWYGIKYRFGGTDRNGIDCSAFVNVLMTGVFALGLPRTCREQFQVSQRISREELREGDLVFFNTRGGISHVGMYLTNNKFVHASVNSGVTISDLNETYYARKYVGAGRIGSGENMTGKAN